MIKASVTSVKEQLWAKLLGLIVTFLHFMCVCVCVAPDGSLAESTPLRDRMALYQAAISKQEVSPTSVNVSPPVHQRPHVSLL